MRWPGQNGHESVTVLCLSAENQGVDKCQEPETKVELDKEQWFKGGMGKSLK